MKINGSNAILKLLENQRVKSIFGIPGTSILPFYDAILNFNIKPVLTTHEQNASFMADAYSRVTGEVGVCVTIQGPGLTNMITGIAQAYYDSSPMIVLVSKAVENNTNFFRLHECDNEIYLSQITKGFFSITSFSDIERVIPIAFQLAASGEPGPVAVEIGTNVFEESGQLVGGLEVSKSCSIIEKQSEVIEKIFELMNSSRSVGIYAGAGALSSTEEVLKLSKIFSAPIATTMSGKGIVSEDYELSVGFGFASGSEKIAQKVFKQCETVLAIGCKFSELSTCGYNMKKPKKLIHIDINPDVIGKNYTPDISLVSDAKIALKQIIKISSENKIKPKNTFDDLIKKWKISNRKKIESINNNDFVHPARFFYELRKKLKNDSIITTDAGNHHFWAIQSLKILRPRTFIAPSNYYAMGFGVPAAVASKVAFPEREVVCVCGDGGFRMSYQELLTAVQEKLNPIIFIFKDDSFGMIKEIQKLKYKRSNGTNFINQDFELLSRSLGANYFNISNDTVLQDTLEKVFESKVITLVEVNIGYSEPSQLINGISRAQFTKKPLGEKIKIISKRFFIK